MTSTPRAFTLVETMVAIAVLAIALVGPFVAIQSSLTASYIARDQLIASSLAQEGMEYIRSIRDNNYLNGRTWLDGLSTYAQCIDSTGHCVVDPSQGDIHTDSPQHSAMQQYASLSNVPFLYISSNYLYTHQTSGTTATKFKRSLQITTLNEHEIRVVVTVTWVTAKQTYTVVVTDTLHDWI